jgi:arabinofuranosyltransferase
LPEHRDYWIEGDIADERMYYYPFTGLLNPARQSHPWLLQGQEIRTNGPATIEHGNVGFLGYYAGPQIHIIDRNGLADPLLARLPVRDPQNWRIGHFRRHVPDGYTETRATGVNHIEQADLARYYEKLALVTQGEWLDWTRLVEIWNLNTGKYDALLQHYIRDYRESAFGQDL